MFQGSIVALITPFDDGKIDTLKSTSLDFILNLNLPSCGSLRSAMFNSDMTFILETMELCMFFGRLSVSFNTPSTL